MAISRAQMMKELLPGLNALFGLEYGSYENEHEDIYEMERRKKSSRLATTTRRLLLDSPLRRKRLRIIFMILSRLATPRLLLVLRRTPSKLRLRSR